MCIFRFKIVATFNVNIRSFPKITFFINVVRRENHIKPGCSALNELNDEVHQGSNIKHEIQSTKFCTV